jgi:hypothetical protein
MQRENLSRRHFKPILKCAGLSEDTRIYDLRHTFGTLWVEWGKTPLYYKGSWGAPGSRPRSITASTLRTGHALKSWRGSESASVAPPDALFGAVGVSLRVSSLQRSRSESAVLQVKE